jgi:hypothetical protein
VSGVPARASVRGASNAFTDSPISDYFHFSVLKLMNQDLLDIEYVFKIG